MTRAEEAAMKAYPVQIVSGPIGLEEQKFDFYGFARAIFIEGYERAEKDLALTWEDIDEIIGFFEDMKEQIIALKLDDETLCKEVLKRFNEQRNGR